MTQLQYEVVFRLKRESKIGHLEIYLSSTAMERESFVSYVDQSGLVGWVLKPRLVGFV